MQYAADGLIVGKILRRYKRFLSDVELPGGEVIVAHTPNTGSMKTCWAPNWPAGLSRSDNPKRKLSHTLELTYNGHTWINVNTSRTNGLAAEGIQNGTIVELQGYPELHREQKVGGSRIDLMLKKGVDRCYVEVKNVSMLGRGRKAIFPDTVSIRGLKHLRELSQLVGQGHRACMLFIVSREDVDSFGPAFSLDEKYAQGLLDAQKAGVEVLVYQCQISPQQIAVVGRLPLRIDSKD